MRLCNAPNTKREQIKASLPTFSLRQSHTTATVCRHKRRQTQKLHRPTGREGKSRPSCFSSLSFCLRMRANAFEKHSGGNFKHAREGLHFPRGNRGRPRRLAAPFVTGLAANGQHILAPHTHKGPLRSALKLQQPVERCVSGGARGESVSAAKEEELSHNSHAVGSAAGEPSLGNVAGPCRPIQLLQTVAPQDVM